MSSRAAPGSRRVSASRVRMYFVSLRSAGSPREDGEPAGIPAQQARQGQQGPALALVPRPDAVPLPQRPAAAEEEKAAAVFVV